jgi:hypothetical protein
MTLAGHTFAVGPNGSACSTCGRRLIDVLTATVADIGRYGVACYGALSEGEYNGIEAERDRLWRAVMAAASAGV